MPNVIPNKKELKTGANALSGLMMGDKRNPGISTAWDAMKGTLQSKIGDRTNYGPNDSVIGSTIHHPMMGIEKALEWLSHNIQTAAGMPNPEMQDEGSIYQMGPSPESQAQAGLNVAGMAQIGSMPMAPRSAGGTLGTMIKDTPGVSYRELGQGPPMFGSINTEFTPGGRAINGLVKDNPGVTYRNMRKK